MATSVQLITVPKGTRVAKCPRGCGMEIYWVEAPRSGGKGTVRIPVECSVLGGAEPDSLSSGRGVNHFNLCDTENE